MIHRHKGFIPGMVKFVTSGGNFFLPQLLNHKWGIVIALSDKWVNYPCAFLSSSKDSHSYIIVKTYTAMPLL